MPTTLKIDFVSDVSCPWCAIGLQSLETALVDPADIPWGEIAFPSTRFALERYLADPAQHGMPAQEALAELAQRNEPASVRECLDVFYRPNWLLHFDPEVGSVSTKFWPGGCVTSPVAAPPSEYRVHGLARGIPGVG
mgnify:CR=1 FL=1